MVVCKQAKWNIRPEHIPLSVVVPFHLSMDGLYIVIDDQQVKISMLFAGFNKNCQREW